MAAGRKHSSLDKVLGRLDQLDQANLHNLVQRLARERALLEAVFNTLQDGVLVINELGEIEYANEAAGRLIGLKDGAPAVLWRLVPGLRTSLEGADPAQVVTREFELSYPQARTVRLYMVPFNDGEKTARRQAVILTDITREKQAAAETIAHEKASSVLLLAAGVAHELGNPLNSLNIHLQLMERKLRRLKSGKDTADLTESVRVCAGEVNRLDGIIRNFLEAVRPRPPDLAELRLGEVVDEVLAFQAREIEDRGVTVESEHHAALPHIQGDRDQLKQVFFNLIKNALEAMQPGGRLSIRLRADDDSVFAAIADTGAGIKQADLARLFQPYHTTKVTGHGLGLMIVERIMRDHGGHVAIESKEGVGTVVTLQFPLKHRRVRMLKSG